MSNLLARALAAVLTVGGDAGGRDAWDVDRSGGAAASRDDLETAVAQGALVREAVSLLALQEDMTFEQAYRRLAERSGTEHRPMRDLAERLLRAADGRSGDAS